MAESGPVAGSGPGPLRLRQPAAEVAADIERVLRQVPCPFVGPLRFAIWQAGRDGSGEDPRQALAGPVSAGHAVAVEFPHLTGTPPAGLRTALTELVEACGSVPSPGKPFLDRAGWWVLAAGTEWFVTVHADCYPIRHSRFWPRSGAVVVLVPKVAFDQGFPAGVPDSTRQAIRLAFARKGVRYPVGGAAIADG